MYPQSISESCVVPGGTRRIRCFVARGLALEEDCSFQRADSAQFSQACQLKAASPNGLRDRATPACRYSDFETALDSAKPPMMLTTGATPSLSITGRSS